MRWVVQKLWTRRLSPIVRRESRSATWVPVHRVFEVDPFHEGGGCSHLHPVPEGLDADLLRVGGHVEGAKERVAVLLGGIQNGHRGVAGGDEEHDHQEGRRYEPRSLAVGVGEERHGRVRVLSVDESVGNRALTPR